MRTTAEFLYQGAFDYVAVTIEWRFDEPRVHALSEYEFRHLMLHPLASTLLLDLAQLRTQYDRIARASLRITVGTPAQLPAGDERTRQAARVRAAMSLQGPSAYGP